MALREIIKYSTSDILRKKCRIVDKIDANTLRLLEDMADTLRNSGGIGLAAPQVGASLRLIVIKDEVNYLKLINPRIIKSEGEQISVEGCLSLPGIYGRVKRPEFAVVQALDMSGQQVEIKVLRRLASVFAHEIDHLEGILFIDKASEVEAYKQKIQ